MSHSAHMHIMGVADEWYRRRFCVRWLIFMESVWIIYWKEQTKNEPAVHI